jgi:hypothetical protein
VAGAVSAITLPVVTTISPLVESQKTARKATIETLKSLYDIVEGQALQAGGAFRDIVKASPRIMGEIARTTRRAFSEFARIGRISLRVFYRVLEKATGSPESIIVATLMYRLVDYAVAVDANSVVVILDGVKESVNKLSLTPPEVSLPRISLQAWITGVEAFYDGAKVIIQVAKQSMPRPERPSIDLGCGAPPEAWDVPGWFRYSFCKIGEAVINGLALLGYYVFSFLLFIVEKMMDFLVVVLEFTKLIIVGLIRLLEFIANGAMTVFETVVKGLLWLVFTVVNLILNTLLKPVFSLIVDYVIKPLAVFIVNAYNWIKNQMKTVICWYLRTAPALVGFRWSYRYIQKRVEAGGLAGLRDILRFGLLGSIGVFAGSFLVVTALLAIIAPECSLMPTATPAYTPPEPPTALAVTYTPSTYTSYVNVEVSVVEAVSAKAPVAYTSRVDVKVPVSESVSTRIPAQLYAWTSVKATASEYTGTRIPLTLTSTVNIKVTAVE